MSGEREIVTLEYVSAVEPIEGADAIELIRLRGWGVVASKGEFAVGDPCIYIEIDSALPLDDPRFAALAPRGSREINGRDYHVLKTARLRGVYSQGIAYPLALFPEALDLPPSVDLAEHLGIFVYEPPLDPVLAEAAVGMYPTWTSKTSSERVQNLAPVWDVITAAGPFMATEKIDGESLTVWRAEDGLHVATRRVELRESDTPHWNAVRSCGLDRLAVGEVLKGELYGYGVKKNPLAVKTTRVAPFSFGTGRTVLPRADWPAWVAEMAAPVHDLPFPDSVEAALAQVDGLESLVTPGRRAEGVVWWQAEGREVAELGYRPSFKVISNRYAQKHDS